MSSKSVSSPPTRADERVMIFIDGSNLYHVMSQHCGRHDLQFGKFSNKLANGRDLRRTYYYNIRQESERNPEAVVDQDRFLRSLYETPYLQVRLGISKARGEAMVEKGVDVMIAIDMLRQAHQDLYDTAVLVSGDGDFFPAIQAVKDLGKHVEVTAFESNIAAEAERVADLHIKLTKTFFSGLWMSRSQKSALVKTTPKDDIDDGVSSPEGEDKKPRQRAKQTTRPRTRSRPSQPSGSGASKQSRNESRPNSVIRDVPRRSDLEQSPPAIRRTPVRRRVGGSARPTSTNGHANDERVMDRTVPPKPPAFRQRHAPPEPIEKGTVSTDSTSENDRQRGRWLRRLGIGGSNS